MDTLKCLSLEQPGAWMLFHGKSIESQKYLISHRGLTLIHAGKLVNKRVLESLKSQIDRYQMTLPLTALPTQAIIGSVELVGCRWSEQVQDGGEPYAYHWYFEKPNLWEIPMPFVAKNVLFDIPLQLVDSHGINFKI